MTRDLVRPRKARAGDHLAVVSPSFAAAGAYPEVHEQAMRRLAEVTGLVPGESEDVGVDWADPVARRQFGEREPTEPWSWHGPPPAARRDHHRRRRPAPGARRPAPGARRRILADYR